MTKSIFGFDISINKKEKASESMESMEKKVNKLEEKVKDLSDHISTSGITSTAPVIYIAVLGVLSIKNCVKAMRRVEKAHVISNDIFAPLTGGVDTKLPKGTKVIYF